MYINDTGRIFKIHHPKHFNNHIYFTFTKNIRLTINMKFSLTSITVGLLALGAANAAPVSSPEPPLAAQLTKRVVPGWKHFRAIAPDASVQLGPQAELLAKEANQKVIFNFNSHGYILGALCIGSCPIATGSSLITEYTELYFDPAQTNFNAGSPGFTNLYVKRDEGGKIAMDWPGNQGLGDWVGTGFSIDDTTGEVRLYGSNPAGWTVCKEVDAESGKEYHRLYYDNYGPQCARIQIFAEAV